MHRTCSTLWQVPIEGEGEKVIGEAGVDAVDKQGRRALLCGIFERRDQLGGQHLPRILQKHRRTADHVDPGRQDTPGSSSSASGSRLSAMAV
ncbi:hypothetical protein MAUB1S_04864 [Mycolicibacterium aubagnense]